MENRLNGLFEQTRNAIKNWWVLLVFGILSIILGIIVFFFPGESYLTLAIWFGIMMLINGVTDLTIALSSRSYFANRGWRIACGIIDILLGLVLCLNPNISIMLLPFLLSFWLMTIGFMAIGFGSDLSKFKFRGSGLSIAGGILLLLLAFAIMIKPLGIGASVIVILLGISFIVAGAMACNIAFKMKDIHKKFENYYGDDYKIVE